MLLFKSLRHCTTAPFFQQHFSRHRISTTAAPYHFILALQHQYHILGGKLTKFAPSKTCATEPCFSKKYRPKHFFSRYTCLVSRVSCLLLYLLYLVSCLLSHVSCLTCLVSHLLSHISCLTSPVSRLLSHISCLRSFVSCLLSHIYCLTLPVSRLMSHVSYLTSHVFCIMSPVSCLPSPPVSPLLSSVSRLLSDLS